MALRRTGALVVIGAALLVAGSNAAGQVQPVDPFGWNACPEIPADAEPVEYQIIPLPLDDSYPDPPRDPKSRPRPWEQLSHLQVIASRADYAAILGPEDATTPQIDWEEHRVIVFVQFIIYQYGDLYSDNQLSGVYVAGDVLLIRKTSTNYTPCQGIAQDPSSFSFELCYSLLVVPRAPERIVRSVCRIGDCPPGIP
jgi:hypothetical protein